MIKRLIILASIFIIIGVTGSIFTINSKFTEKQTIEKEVDLENIEQIEAHIDNAAVDIIPTTSTKAKVKFTGDISTYDFEEKTDKQTWYIFLKEKGITLFNVDIFSFGQSLQIELPEKVYESIKVDADNGRVTLNDLQANLLEAKTDNGRINVKNVVSKEILLVTQNGRIKMENLAGEVQAHTSNGRIEVNMERIEQSLTLTSNNGAINIFTAIEPENVIIDAHTDNGGITVYGEKMRDIMSGTGDHYVKLRTDNGNITLEKR